MERKIKEILGYKVDTFSFKEAVEYGEERIKTAQSTQVITINPEMIEMGEKNPELADILKNADLIVPDGVGIKIALKIEGFNQERVPGIEFSKEMIRFCAQNSRKIALIGASENVIQKAAENLKKEFETLDIAYIHNGFFDSNEEAKIISELEKIQPSLVLVALGVPKQEYFINKYRNNLPNTMFIGVGGSFDVWSGEVQRAPIAFQKLGCEWLYRVLKQPSRFKRIFPTLPMFLIKVIIEKVFRKK